MAIRLNLGAVLVLLLQVCCVDMAFAHHVLGRPSYALNEDSNTPPALQVETLIGDFDVNYMVYPAFPKPGEPGRIHLYIKNSTTMQSFDGKVTFLVRDDSFLNSLGFGNKVEKLGGQLIDDFVYRQGFMFSQPGKYVITAQFEANDEPYTIDFPLRIGAASPWGPISIAAILIFGLLAGVTLIQRRRALTEKIREQLRSNGN